MAASKLQNKANRQMKFHLQVIDYWWLGRSTLRFWAGGMDFGTSTPLPKARVRASTLRKAEFCSPLFGSVVVSPSCVQFIPMAMSHEISSKFWRSATFECREIFCSRIFLPRQEIEAQSMRSSNQLRTCSMDAKIQSFLCRVPLKSTYKHRSNDVKNMQQVYHKSKSLNWIHLS